MSRDGNAIPRQGVAGKSSSAAENTLWWGAPTTCPGHGSEIEYGQVQMSGWGAKLWFNRRELLPVIKLDSDDFKKTSLLTTYFNQYSPLFWFQRMYTTQNYSWIMKNLESTLEHYRGVAQWSHHCNDVKTISNFMLDCASAQWSHFPQPQCWSLHSHFQNEALFGASHPTYLMPRSNIKWKKNTIHTR